MEGIQCNEVMGAMYAFPQVLIPKKAQEEAKVFDVKCCLRVAIISINIFIDEILKNKTKLLRKKLLVPENPL